MLTSLHSNLVLFKLLLQFACPYHRIYFTFQSGSIQMAAGHATLKAVVIFTFQSGSIQIHGDLSIKLLPLYFTFQSGSIQISP